MLPPVGVDEEEANDPALRYPGGGADPPPPASRTAHLDRPQGSYPIRGRGRPPERQLPDRRRRRRAPSMREKGSCLLSDPLLTAESRLGVHRPPGESPLW